jgi:hypothetical protein
MFGSKRRARTTISNAFFALLLLTLGGVNIASALAAPASELIPFWDDREETSQLKVDHTPWQTLLDTYLDDQHSSGISRFDYAGVSNFDTRTLRSYLEYLQSLDPRQLNDQEQKAYWINLYNAYTVFLVVSDRRNLETIRQIKSGLFTAGPWSKKTLLVLHQELSLDDIEHGILRPIWKDNRIHYAVNCASLGCPNMSKTAFTSENTEALLEGAAEIFVNHRRAASVNNEGRLVLSEIYDWYKEDFGGNLGGILSHLRKYARPELLAELRNVTRVSYEYDWALNRP